MRKFISKLLLTSIIFVVIAYFYDGFHVSGFGIALVASFVLGLLNTLVKPVLKILSLPITCLTFGLFSLVINALMLSLTSWIVGDGFSFSSFWATLLVSIIMAVFTALINVEEY